MLRRVAIIAREQWTINVRNLSTSDWRYKDQLSKDPGRKAQCTLRTFEFAAHCGLDDAGAEECMICSTPHESLTDSDEHLTCEYYTKEQQQLGFIHDSGIIFERFHVPMDKSLWKRLRIVRLNKWKSN